MDTIDIEAFSFMWQQIVRRILYEVNRQGLQLPSLGVIDAVVQYFHQGVPVWNHSFLTILVGLALSIHLAQF